MDFDFGHEIIFSGEIHSYHGGLVNCPNCRVVVQKIHEWLMRNKWVYNVSTVLCESWAGGVFDAFSSEIAAGQS